MTTQTARPTVNLTPPSAMRRRRNYRFITSRALSYLILTFAALMFVYPLLWLLSSSLKPNFEIYREPLRLIPSQIQLDAYNDIFRSTPILRYFGNSLLYSISGTLISLGFATLAAYAVSRFDFRGKRMLMLGLLALQLLPALISIVPTYILMQALGLYNSQAGLIALYGVISIPWGVWVLKGYFDTLPKELDESAFIDGATRLTMLWRILVPILVPGLASSFIIIFIGRWGEFALASVLLRNQQFYSLPVGTFALLGPDEQDFRLLSAAALVNIVPVLIIFSILQRYLISGLAAGAVKQ